MAVSRMKKLTAVTLKGVSDVLIRRLMWLRCAEISSCSAPDKEIGKLQRPAEYQNRARERTREAEQLENAVSVLRGYEDSKPGLFRKRRETDINEFEHSDSLYEKSCGYAEQVARINEEKAGLNLSMSKITSNLRTLEVWKDLDLPLDFPGTRTTSAQCGILPPGADTGAVNAMLSQDVENGEAQIIKINSDDSGVYVLCICFRKYENQMQSSLIKSGFTRLNISDICRKGEDNTPAAITERLKKQLEEITAREEQLENQLKELAANIPDMEYSCDLALSYACEEDSKSKSLETDKTVIITAWVPMRAQKRVEAELEKTSQIQNSPIYYEFEDPEPDEDPPVLLINRPAAAPFENVIGLYSLPAYGTFDPTFIMAIFYFVIFGLMLGDFVYGLLLTVGGFLAVKFLDLSDSMKKMIKMFAICGISCMIAGILFGGYMGDLPSQFSQNMLGKGPVNSALWFDIIADPVTFLALTMVVGALHLFAGMGIQFYILCKEHRVFDAIADIGSWYVLFGGLIVMLLGFARAGQITALAGVAMLVLTQGRHEKNVIMKLLKGIMSLYDIISYISDLLSYSRIMSLGLASAVIAQVVNIFATMGGPSVGGFLMFPLILIAGHAVNLVINLLGTFVHTSRLQYIEFFGKFYVDGGRPFSPAQPASKYTNPVIDDADADASGRREKAAKASKASKAAKAVKA